MTGPPDAIEFLRPILRELDKPEQQVEIEARIVQTTHESARALGIQWGASGAMTQALGNTTKLAFPNTVQVAGAAQDSSGKPATTGNTGSVVNLPAQSGSITPSTGVGLALGAVNGAFNVDVALTALEHKGNTEDPVVAEGDDPEQRHRRGDAGHARCRSRPCRTTRSPCSSVTRR